MTRSLAFWILMLLWLVAGVGHHFGWFGEYGVLGVALVPFLLFLLLGWQVFGPPLR